MAFLTGYASASRRASTGVIPTIAWSHPLAQGLQAAYYPGVFPNVPIINLASPGNGDLTLQGGGGGATTTPIVATPEGPGINVAGTGTTTRNVNGLCPTSLLQNGSVSLFVRGQWIGSVGGANQPCRIFGIYYSGSGSVSPFAYYNICASDGAQAQVIGSSYADSASAFVNPTYAGTRTLVANTMTSGGAVMVGNRTTSVAPIIYQNGVKFTGSAASDISFFGASPQIGIGDNSSSRTAAFVVTAAYAWNRQLSSQSMLYLHNNPYSLLRWPIDLVYDILEQQSSAPSIGAPAFKPMLFSPLMVAGGAMEWLGRRKMTMRRLRGE